MSWQDWPRAPAPGTPICPAEALKATASFDLAGFPLLLVRTADGPRGYVNACPHQYLPLDFRGPRVLSSDGTRLICTAHQATFDAGTGTLLCGPADAGLEPVPIREEAGMLVIG